MRSKEQERDKEQGFTLLEMLLVFILIAGSGFVLLVKLPVNLEKEHLVLASTQLLADIRDTRQAALSENSWYSIKFYYQSGDQHYQVFRQGTKVKDVFFKDGIRFLGSPTNLSFNAMGRGVGSTIVLTNSRGERRNIVVAPVGMRIREE
jgi:Type II secretory pathway, pseudopilin PulG